MLFALHFPGALVVAMDPGAQNFELMRKTADRFDIVCLRAALPGQPGMTSLVDIGQGNWDLRAERRTKIPGAAPAQLYDDHVSDCVVPFIAKIDFEGSEKTVVAKNTERMDQTPLLIVELHDWLLPKAGISTPFLQCIAKLDRAFVHLLETVFSINNNT